MHKYGLESWIFLKNIRKWKHYFELPRITELPNIVKNEPQILEVIQLIKNENVHITPLGNNTLKYMVILN
jgi:hypothetical protein